MGAGTRPFASGGRSDRGAKSGGVEIGLLVWQCRVVPIAAAAAAAAGSPVLTAPIRMLMRLYAAIAGRGNTYWGLHSNSGRALVLPPCDFGPYLNFVGAYRGFSVGSPLLLLLHVRRPFPF